MKEDCKMRESFFCMQHICSGMFFIPELSFVYFYIDNFYAVFQCLGRFCSRHFCRQAKACFHLRRVWKSAMEMSLVGFWR